MGEHDFVTKERERLLVALDEGARSWEIDKERILKNWSEETEILTLVRFITLFFFVCYRRIEREGGRRTNVRVFLCDLFFLYLLVRFGVKIKTNGIVNELRCWKKWTDKGRI